MLYPKMTFSDVTDRIETLAKRREFKVHSQCCLVCVVCSVGVAEAEEV